MPPNPRQGVKPARQQHVRARLNVPAQNDQRNHNRQSRCAFGGRIAEEPIGRQQHPRQPDRHVRDGVEQPEDEEAAERINQPGEPAAPGAEPPRSREQEHPQARHPQPASGHPGEGTRSRASHVREHVEGIKDGALAVREVRSTAAGGAVPQRQPAAANHAAVELEPRLELKHRIHQQPVGWLKFRRSFAPKTRRNEEHVRRAQDLAAKERLMKKRRDARHQAQSECKNLAAPFHGLLPPCLLLISGRDRTLDRLDALDQHETDHFHSLVRIFGFACIRVDIHTRSADAEHFRMPDVVRAAAVQAHSKWPERY